MNQIDFKPVFDHIDQKFAEYKDIYATKEDLSELRSEVGAYAKTAKDYYQEVTVVVSKVARMESWIKEVANKVGVEYKV